MHIEIASATTSLAFFGRRSSCFNFCLKSWLLFDVCRYKWRELFELVVEPLTQVRQNCAACCDNWPQRVRFLVHFNRGVECCHLCIVPALAPGAVPSSKRAAGGAAPSVLVLAAVPGPPLKLAGGRACSTALAPGPIPPTIWAAGGAAQFISGASPRPRPEDSCRFAHGGTTVVFKVAISIVKMVPAHNYSCISGDHFNLEVFGE